MEFTTKKIMNEELILTLKNIETLLKEIKEELSKSNSSLSEIANEVSNTSYAITYPNSTDINKSPIRSIDNAVTQILDKMNN